ESRAAEIAASNAQAAADNLKAVTVIDATAQKNLDREKEITAQKQLDNERILAEARLAEAEAATKRANEAMIEMLAFIVMFVAVMLLIVRLLTLHPVVVVKSAPQSDWVQRSANSIARRGSSADDMTMNIT